MFEKTILDNGVRILSERLPFATASLGIWIDTGSRDEVEAEAGCAHFVEHMLFKGTADHSAQQIARELDGLGGMSNAFTSKETTCLYSTVLNSHLPRLADLLAELFFDSTFAPEEVQRERQVILQEISMVEDTPDDQVHDLFASLIWPDHSLGRGVLGSRETVEGFESQALQEFTRRHYTADRIIISAAGAVDHDQLCSLFADRFSRLTPLHQEKAGRYQPPPAPPNRLVVQKALEQVHMITGTYGLPAGAEERYAFSLLNIVLGGNMSSRLFQEIREKHGLAYSVFSYLASFVDSGYVGIYLGVDQKEVNRAMELVHQEIDKLSEGTISEEELANAREYAKGIMYLSAENMEARMTRLALHELQFNRRIPFEEVAAAIDGVGAEEIRDLAQRLFQGHGWSAAILGPLEPDAIDWNLYD
jgi:predicted Zn-dependent peptidase